MAHFPSRLPRPLIVILGFLALIAIGRFFLTPSLVKLAATAIDLGALWCVAKRYRLMTYAVAVIFVAIGMTNIEQALANGTLDSFIVGYNAIYIFAALYLFTPQMTQFLNGPSNNT